MNQSNQFFSLVQLALVLLIGIGFVSGILGQQNGEDMKKLIQIFTD